MMMAIVVKLIFCERSRLSIHKVFIIYILFNFVKNTIALHANFSNGLQIIVAILAIQITFLEYEFDFNKLDSNVMKTHKGILDFFFFFISKLRM